MNLEELEFQHPKGRFSSLKTWGKLVPFLKPYSKQMTVVLILMMLGAGCDIMYPLLSGYAVDNFITP